MLIMKKFICGLLIGSICTLSIGSLANGVWNNISVLKNDINVVVNGETVTADNFLYNDITYLPLRAVSEALGETVEYDETDNTAYIGERVDKDTMKSKYTPPVDLKNYTILDNEIYYITAQYIIDLAENKGLKTNVDELIMNDKLELEIDGKTWYMVFINLRRCIPYDTYVDEIEPLLKYN